MARNKYSDPSYFLQAYDKGHNPLHTNILRESTQKKKTDDEVKVVADLLYSLTHTTHAFAIAANQRGWTSPIFITRWALEDINGLPVADELTEKHQEILRNKKNITLYRNPSYIPLTKEEYTMESCLSLEGDEHLVGRFSVIQVTVEVLDMVARRGNRSRNHWIKRTFTLEGLPAQIFQHEYDHFLGLGLWNTREI